MTGQRGEPTSAETDRISAMEPETPEGSGASDSPFGTPHHGRRRVVRWLLYAGAPLAALAVVLLLRERTSEPDAAAGAHVHGATAGDSVRQPVELSADEARRIGVTYATVGVGSIAREVRTVGQVTFDETRVKIISTRIEGWVERLFVDFTGQPVRVGDPLLSIYSPMLVSAQEELLLARRLSSEMAGAASDASRGAEDLVRSARRRLEYLDVSPGEIAAIERTGQVTRAMTLRATAGGVVIEKLVMSGQRVMAGDALYRVADLAVVWVEGDVFEQDLAAVRVGLPVLAEFDALAGEQRSGRIAYIYPTLDPETRTARVRVELSNPGLRLKPGMYATFRFTSMPRAGVLSVPRSAVLSTGERSLVFVRREDGRLEPRTVRIGSTSAERVEVLEGLSAGETVVASATFLIDAESNLRSALGGMGSMPGMDMTAPVPLPGSPTPKR